MIISFLKYLPAILALIGSVTSFITYMRARKIAKVKVINDLLRDEIKRLDGMAAIAASPVSDEEVERRLASGQF